MKDKKTIGIVLVIIVILLLLIAWAAGTFSSPVTSVIPIISPTFLPSITPTPVLTPVPTVNPTATTSFVPTPMPVPAITLVPVITPSSLPTWTPMPTIGTGGASGGDGGGNTPAHTPIATLTPMPTLTPTPTSRPLASPTRDLPISIKRGSVFNVVISFIAPYGDFNAIVLQDTSPAGWTIQKDKNWCTPVPEYANIEGGAVQYLWYGPYASGTEFTVLYKVSVPEDAALGIYTFNGQLNYYIAGSSLYSENTSGDSQVAVILP